MLFVLRRFRDHDFRREPIRTTAIFAETLRKLGAKNVERRWPGWSWWGNPIAATTLGAGTLGAPLTTRRPLSQSTS
jgi:hypothetical protein